MAKQVDNQRYATYSVFMRVPQVCGGGVVDVLLKYS
jgi:hypothetical protein